MSRIAGRRPKASGQISTPAWAPAVGWKKAASQLPSGVLIDTSVSVTAGSAAPEGRPAAVKPLATEAATKWRRVRSPGLAAGSFGSCWRGIGFLPRSVDGITP